MSRGKEKNLKFLAALSHFPKFGPRRLKKIRKHFPQLENAFNASAKELAQAGIEEGIAAEFLAARVNINPDAIWERMENENVKIIGIENILYPKLLKEIYDPPEALYYGGELIKEDEFSIAVVGARKFTSYGKRAAEEITAALARNGLTVISGLALGIDTLAHLAALEAGGRTIAVLGSGLDRQSIYPSSNRYIADKIIASGGAIVSEFPLGTPALPHHFPQRNRIISGLALGVIVIEASEKSGSLITAGFALEQNREVFAVPGSIFSPLSAGANQLIKKGARPITRADEILEALDLARITDYIGNKKILPETREEEIIISNLAREPLHINDLIRLTRLDTSKINATLTIMEMKGMVKNLGNMMYVILK